MSAGTDRQVALDGLGVTEADALSAWSGGRSLPTTDAFPELVAHLVQLGVLTPDLATPRSPRSGGDIAAGGIAAGGIVPGGIVPGGIVAADDRLTEALEAVASAIPAIPPSLTVVLRCGPNDGDVAEAERPTGARLIVDVGNEHTIVFGPLVIPGRTSCETCLDRLMARRWPVVAQPSSPAAASSPLLAPLTAAHLALVEQGRSPLINATSSFDLTTMTSRLESLLMSPSCPTCATGARSGRIELPWL